MNGSRYSFAGWLAITKVIISIPILILSVFFEGKPVGFMNMVFAISAFAFLIIDIYLFWLFKELLNDRFEFHETDQLIYLIILANIIFGVINMFGWVFFDIRNIVKIIMMVLFVPVGALLIYFGYKLLRLKDSLFSLLKPYAYTTIASGICCITLIFIFFGLLIGMAAGIIMGIIFIRSAEQVEFV
jgi:hypothetical protein